MTAALTVVAAWIVLSVPVGCWTGRVLARRSAELSEL